MEEAFLNIDIQTTEHSIRLAPADDGRCRLVCTDSDEISHSLTVENDTLTVRRIDNRRRYEWIGVYLDAELSATLYLPKKEYRALFAAPGDCHKSMPIPLFCGRSF